MSQPLVCCQSPSPFMQPNQQGNDWNAFYYPQQPTLYQPVQPRRNRSKRKRKLEETDIDTTTNNDIFTSDNRRIFTNETQTDNKPIISCLPFIKPSNKRRRTNGMSKPNQQALIIQPDLEQNIYTHNNEEMELKQDDDSHHQGMHCDTGNEADDDDDDDDDDNIDNDTTKYRIETPYKQHPYLRNKAKRKLSLEPIENIEESPEFMFSKLNINLAQNESIKEWRSSIETQLNNARHTMEKQLNLRTNTELDRLCERIQSIQSDLGRNVLMAKLRKSLSSQEFEQLCRKLSYS